MLHLSTHVEIYLLLLAAVSERVGGTGVMFVPCRTHAAITHVHTHLRIMLIGPKANPWLLLEGTLSAGVLVSFDNKDNVGLRLRSCSSKRKMWALPLSQTHCG